MQKSIDSNRTLRARGNVRCAGTALFWRHPAQKARAARTKTHHFGNVTIKRSSSTSFSKLIFAATLSVPMP